MLFLPWSRSPNVIIQDGADLALWRQELAHGNNCTAMGPPVLTMPWMLLSRLQESSLGCTLLDRLGQLDPPKDALSLRLEGRV